MKKKLLSPVELKELRLQQEEQRKLRAEEEKRKLRENLNKNSKRLTSPKDLLDPQPVVEPTIEIKEEPVVVEEPKDPIEVLRERLEEVAASIKEPKFYDEELAELEVQISSKVNLEEYNLEPVNQKIGELREYVSELPENVDRLTERVDELQVSGSEIFQQHGESLREIKKVTHQMLKDLDKLSKLKIPEVFDPSDIQNDIASTKETFYERIAELRKEVSELPEVKYYDDELTSLKENIESVQNSIPELQERIESVQNSIPEVSEVKYSDVELTKLQETFYEIVTELKKEVSELPEVKYYDTELTELQERIESVQNSIPEVSEVKYYESDLKVLSSRIEEVRNEIPELPEVKYYEKEISSLTKALSEVEKSIPKITQKDIINLKLKVNTLENKIPDDNKSEITSLNKSLNDITEAVIIMKSSLRNVSKTVNNIPENVDWTHEIDYLYKEIEKLKERPVSIKEDADPLLPLEQKFVTFEDLAKHYRTFINRIQQQLTSLGGGGEVNLRFLDDIDRTSIIDGRVLSYDAATKKFVFISPGAASSLWNETVGGDIYRNSSVGINTADPQVALDVVGDASITGVVTATSFYGDGSNLTGVDADTAVYATNAGIASYADVAGIATYATNAGISSYADVAGIATVAENLTGSPSIQVTNITGVDATFTGNVSIAGTLTYEDVTNIDAIGLVTARSGIEIGFPGAATTLSPNGNATFSGVVTATSFVGEFVGNLDKTLEYQSGTLSTITTSEGTKTFYYDGAGILTSIVGTGVYVSKEFTYDGGGNLISVNVL